MSPITKKFKQSSNAKGEALNLSVVSDKDTSNNIIMYGSTADNNGPSSPSSSCSSNTTKNQYGRVNRIVLDKTSEEYKKRRERNNEAVKKSRNKSKQRTQLTLQRVVDLKAENDRLATRVNLLSKELNFLKDLFLTHAGTANGSVNVQNELNMFHQGSHENNNDITSSTDTLLHTKHSNHENK